MNDIEVLEELIKNEHGELLNCWDYGEEAKQAIENLLKERQSDKERIKDLEEENEKIKSSLTNTAVAYANSIPKSLIKEKIEEYKKEIEKVYIQFLESNKTDEKLHTKGIMLEGKIQVLEELLKGE